MMNLIIGLCFGVVSAIALVVMWRMTERLRKEGRSQEIEPAEPDAATRPHIADDSL
jgi:hypothetical protein